MYYTYMLQSEKDVSYYIEFTKQLQKRIRQHNTGKSTYSIQAAV
ncbi:GIY-YIG nuclease family protein [candidate division KSB1 bacterium]